MLKVRACCAFLVVINSEVGLTWNSFGGVLGSWRASWVLGCCAGRRSELERERGKKKNNNPIFTEKSSDMRTRLLGQKDRNIAAWVSEPCRLVPVMICDCYCPLTGCPLTG